ncbi:MAG: FHA domain-containing protein [Rhodobacter sp.]|nr:FHA domain-containing protein [Rhodobacter sp.]
MEKNDHPGSQREKTRFLRFQFSTEKDDSELASFGVQDTECQDIQSPYGSLWIVGGPGSGESIAIRSDFARIGRGDGQEIQLAFGDSSISRDSHAVIAFYGEKYGCVIRDGRKVNPVLLNSRPLAGESPLNNGDLIQIGKTMLRFVKPGRLERT